MAWAPHLVQVVHVLHAVQVVGVQGVVGLVVSGVAHIHGDGVNAHAHHSCDVAVAGAVRGQPCGGFLAQTYGGGGLFQKTEDRGQGEGG